MKKISDLFRKQEITYASGLVCPKTTALFFDKIWVPSERDFLGVVLDESYLDIPDGIGFSEYDLAKKKPVDNSIYSRGSALISSSVLCDLERRDAFIIAMREGKMKRHILSNRGMPIEEVIKNIHLYDSSKFTNGKSIDVITQKVKKNDFRTSTNRNQGIAETVEVFRKRYGIEMTPIFVEKTEFEKAFTTDTNKENYEHSVIDASIQAIPTIVEDGLSWEQVVDFRKDKKEIAKMRKFRNWANQNLEGKSSAEITDILCGELEDYESALKKHGIKTVIGGFSTIVAGAGTILPVILGSHEELAGAGLAVTATVITITSDQAMDYYEKKNTPIAFIYDVAKKVNK